jgi:hypothetical protein
MAAKQCRTVVTWLLAGLALVVVGVVGASRLKQEEPEQHYRAELVDATPVQQGQMTDKQRIHGRLYSNYNRRMFKPISEFVAQGNTAKRKDRILGVDLLIGMVSLPTEPESETPNVYFGGLARSSDAVVRGAVLSKVSQITEDDWFVFTDYDFEVREVLKNTSKASLESGSAITVTRPGGKIVEDGVIIKVTDQAFAPLPMNRDIVLFLRLVEETGAYRATSDTGAFELGRSSVRALTGEHFPPGVLDNDVDSFLVTLRNITNR